MKTYSKDEILDKIKSMQGWNYFEDQIQREYKFKDFITAIKVVNKVAEEAEKVNHHPDILIFSWNKVLFKLSTHSEKGVTDKDFNLAEKINSLAERESYNSSK